MKKIILMMITSIFALAIDEAVMHLCIDKVTVQDRRTFIESRAVDTHLIAQWFNDAANAHDMETLQSIGDWETITRVRSELMKYETLVYPIEDCRMGAQQMNNEFEMLVSQIQRNLSTVRQHQSNLGAFSIGNEAKVAVVAADVFSGECYSMTRKTTLAQGYKVEKVGRTCTRRGVPYVRIRYRDNQGKWQVGWLRADTIVSEQVDIRWNFSQNDS